MSGLVKFILFSKFLSFTNGDGERHVVPLGCSSLGRVDEFAKASAGPESLLDFFLGLDISGDF